MALVSVIPVKRDIPHEPGQWMELRQLNRSQLREARKKQEREQREVIKDFGAQFLRDMQSDTAEQSREKLQKLALIQEYDVDSYDIDTLLRKGIASWSYDKTCETDQIDLLDPVTARWAAQAILNLGKPKTEEQEKNASELSMSR